MKYYLVEYRMGDPSGAVITSPEYAWSEWDAVEQVRARWGHHGVYIMSVRPS
jgi:hypothetical protein